VKANQPVVIQVVPPLEPQSNKRVPAMPNILADVNVSELSDDQLFSDVSLENNEDDIRVQAELLEAQFEKNRVALRNQVVKIRDLKQKTFQKIKGHRAEIVFLLEYGKQLYAQELKYCQILGKDTAREKESVEPSLNGKTIGDPL
jgi:hypothetical protein